ncbi:hypothetical protein BS50DRAFT_576023 [Corynespora cassiicola Philippines]|uniref:Uncharacterized protein n=1 Tax=Corynespora cassiicola Philippines TaxID=1448308 RepID=A0A2T2NGL8_CORCC|nr:hypothetical protein BS50DRAFT_576023 [Corynespora cassiicola Philippines]
MAPAKSYSSFECTVSLSSNVTHCLKFNLDIFCTSVTKCPSETSIQAILQNHRLATLPFHSQSITALLHQPGSGHFHRGSTTTADMCWITLTPAKAKRKHPDHHHHHSDHGSSVEELVRVRRDASSSRFSKVRIVIPNSTISEHPHHHPHLHPHLHTGHHHHPHLHPLHMHPVHDHHHHHHHRMGKLHGSGRKRCPAPPPPPPSRSPSSCPSPKEPIYRTQIVEPRTQEIRETTRIALRQARPERGRLRRVAGYEVLGGEVPWSWDCVSSVAGSGTSKGTKKGGGLNYPPFGSSGSWM